MIACTERHPAIAADGAEGTGPAGDDARAPEGGRRTTPPRQATSVLLVSAVTGFPPLLAVSVYLGRTPMRPVAFAATCLLGRTIRFVTIALAPRFAGY
jgi:membrane protein YqaA with SNARE-associated domain